MCTRSTNGSSSLRSPNMGSLRSTSSPARGLRRRSGTGPARSPFACCAPGVRQPVRSAELRAASAHGRPERRNGGIRIARDGRRSSVEPATPGPAGLLEITTSDERRPIVAGARMHRSGVIDGKDVTTVSGIPVTTPELTIYSLSSRFAIRQLGRMVDDAVRRNIMTLDDLRGRWSSGCGLRMAAAEGRCES